jgi:predicted transcriptional regulator
MRDGMEGELTTRLCTHVEIARALGITRESARKLVRRKQWRRERGDDGKARVQAPEDIVEGDMSEPTALPKQQGEPDLVVTALTRHIDRLEQELVIARIKVESYDDASAQVGALKGMLEATREDRDRWHMPATRR